LGKELKMGIIEGYIPYVTHKGTKYYYLASADMWTPNFLQISLSDLNEEKVELTCLDFPHDSSTYSHAKITLTESGDY
jgi:hypothetical protein